MFTAEQYRAKAAAYSELVKSSNNPNEFCEFRRLERSFTELADDEPWVTDNHDRTLNAAEHGKAGGVIFPAEEAACLSITGSGGYQSQGEMAPLRMPKGACRRPAD
jgi:hypothetical protein